MAVEEGRSLLPGIEVLSSGEVMVSKDVGETLFDLALGLGDELQLPVDVQHVLGAVVLADRAKSLTPDEPLADSPRWRALLNPYVQEVFVRFGGKLGRDD